MALACEDLSHERTDAVRRRFGAPRAWTRDDVGPEDCVVELAGAARAELDRLIARVRAQPLPVVLRSPRHYELPALRALMAEVRRRLDESFGVAVVDRLPLDDLDPEDAIAAFWILGAMLGRPVAQKWDGTMIYDVRDTGQKYGYGVRGSYTNVELVFHTDNAFGIAPPDHVGLLCFRPARSGGVSRFCSLYTVHDRLLDEAPALLERLYRPMLWDRQAEHAEGEAKVASAPMFRFDGERLRVRANSSLVRKGYDVAGETMDDALAAALEAVDRISAAPDLWFELPIERGQLQYLDNRDVAHYRSEFEDHPEPHLKRHLVRTWHRDRGLPTYDG